MPVVARDNTARNTNRKTSASRGKIRLISELARRVVFDLVVDEVSGVADVRALRPRRTVSRPEMPPIEASFPGPSNTIIGPKITTVVATNQPMIAITNQ